MLGLVAVVAQRIGRRTRRDARRAGARPQLRHIRVAATFHLLEAGHRAEALANDALERKAEILGEQRIDHWIDGRVAVAQPKEERKHQRLDAVVAERAYQVHGEEWQPADDEQADDDGQRFGRLRFHAEPFHLRLDIPLAHFLARPRRQALVQIGHALEHLQVAIVSVHTRISGGHGRRTARRSGAGGSGRGGRIRPAMVAAGQMHVQRIRFLCALIAYVLGRRIGHGYFDFFVASRRYT